MAFFPGAYSGLVICKVAQFRQSGSWMVSRVYFQMSFASFVSRTPACLNVELFCLYF
jgi:hypothetical protein